jgi:hypothetical protein
VTARPRTPETPSVWTLTDAVTAETTARLRIPDVTIVWMLIPDVTAPGMSGRMTRTVGVGKSAVTIPAAARTFATSPVATFGAGAATDA